MKSERLDTLQAGRGIAALIVVIFHANGYFAFHGLPSYQFLQVGQAGVVYFFVLSGFIMLHVHRSWIGHREKTLEFLKRRFLRVYPIYWIVTAAVVAAMIVSPAVGAPGDREPLRILTSALLIHTDKMPIVYPAWSLEYEVIFYGFFAFLILAPRLGISLFAAYVVAGLIGCFDSGPYPDHMLVARFNIFFVLGFVAAEMARRPLPRPAYIAAVSGVVFVAAAELGAYGKLAVGPKEIILAIAATGLIAGLVRAEMAGSVKVGPALRRLGDASYSLYLVHAPAAPFFGGLARKLGMTWFALPFTVAAIVVRSILFHQIVEKPMLQIFSRRRRPSKQMAAAAAD